jgi:hypothetical protein
VVVYRERGLYEGIVYQKSYQCKDLIIHENIFQQLSCHPRCTFILKNTVLISNKVRGDDAVQLEKVKAEVQFLKGDSKMAR